MGGSNGERVGYNVAWLWPRPSVPYSSEQTSCVIPASPNLRAILITTDTLRLLLLCTCELKALSPLSCFGQVFIPVLVAGP